MSSSSGSGKLHPIYVSLDNHQYNRAVKLASALPPSNLLGQALLAHALQKSGDPIKALQVIRGILWFESAELNYEIDRLQSGTVGVGGGGVEGGTSSSASASKRQARSKKSSSKANSSAKKGRTMVPEPSSKTSTSLTASLVRRQMETPLVLPVGWDQAMSAGKQAEKQVITDQTTLDTIVVTLQALRLYTTTYQLYLAVSPPTLQTLHKAYTTGLYIVAMSAKYNHVCYLKNDNNKDDIVATTLAGMQVTALQLARMTTSTTSTESSANKDGNCDDDNDDVVKMWAAQTALWQLQHYDCAAASQRRTTDADATSGTTDVASATTKQQQRLQMLPRLAESLANKYRGNSAEASLLYLETLFRQDKHEEIVDWLSSSSSSSQSHGTSTCALTSQQRMEVLASAYERLEQWEAAQQVYQKLLHCHSEQWSYWLGLLKNAYRGAQDMERTSEAVKQQLETLPAPDRPCRSRNLIRCELAAVSIRGLTVNEDDNGDDTKESDNASMQDLERLQSVIVGYGDVFSSRALCAYSDLTSYIELLLDSSITSESIDSFLGWASEMRSKNKSITDRSMLRSNTFAIQVIYKVLSMSNDEAMIERWLPEWEDLVSEWRSSQKLGTAKAGETVQKENQPGDELVLLAIQNILFRNDAETGLLMAASLLEEALQHSPYNAYLKIAAMDVYAQLNAVHRSWDLFQGLSIKHIQLDSCTYLILPKLVDGGLYNEAILLSNDLLKFHASMARDSGEYAAQAMEHGTLSKANEFLVFQRDRMNRSLALFAAKALIMNCAPLLHSHSKTQSLGRQHGIVGKDTDLDRIDMMAREAYDPFGAPSIMAIASRAHSEALSSDDFSDNRDRSVLSFQILYPSTKAKDQIMRSSIRSGLLHRLLVRLTLCLDATPGPKKGKVTKPTELLQQQCRRLLDAANQVATFIETSDDSTDNEKAFMEPMLTLCQIVAHVSSGAVPSSEDGDAGRPEDTLASREQCASRLLDTIVIPTTTGWSIPQLCRFLPEVLVPFIVILRMTENLFALYGWGKRKRYTRTSAGSLAQLASNLKVTVEAMRQEMASLPSNDYDCSNKAKELCETVLAEMKPLDEAVTRNVCQIVSSGQQLTRNRVVPFLDEMLGELSSFEIEDV